MDLINLIKELGISAVAIYMMIRIENKLEVLTVKIMDLCNKIGD
jgi:hypothetical protein